MRFPYHHRKCALNLGLLALASLAILPLTFADEFPTTYREMRDTLNRRRANPERPSVFCVFTVDGCSALERNQAFEWSGGLRAYRNPLSKSRPPGFLEPDVYFLQTANGSYRLWVRHFPSAGQAVEAMLKRLDGRLPLATLLSSSPIAGPVYPEPPRHFLGMDWNGKRIGEFSFGKRFGGWEGHALYAVTFLAGNLCVTVEGYPQDNIERPLDPDPRQIAAALDEYYSQDPTTELSDAEKSKRNTLHIEIQSPKQLVTGTTYPITCPLKQAGEDLVEVRFRVTHGEVFEVVADSPESPRRGTLPMHDRRFSVRFMKPGRQRLSCYHISAEGECIARGELEVDVSEE